MNKNKQKQSEQSNNNLIHNKNNKVFDVAVEVDKERATIILLIYYGSSKTA
jgi:hypothetical protein